MAEPVTSSHQYDEYTSCFTSALLSLPPLELLVAHPTGGRLGRIDESWLVHMGADSPDLDVEWVFPAVLAHAGGQPREWTATYETYGELLLTHFTR